ncbi:PAB1 binding protein [Exophiala xenobiotica]|uniref:PAB1 binding protein n=1 Tax=Vermiconidia calcicola TaxID=1690605 RepID=A0AAV9PU72_9PEZI|nr:PAB1 binding protein [Exophiala xenobiotica]KAK5434610.1 PAB1 binding protein [Exophiala xenobiotica]KAK5436387.1 PAB1 binding protein [Exophiala xenobiotica]KAK5528203.1 PAB1 binding protein [Vermiconidia calcicola]KAK5532134.1 PAB1 binding protein [Chaetothyriales sp. CCFEE 6169]
MSSTKRPLEDPSSPSAPTDLPDAKRPALDKVVKEQTAPEASESAEATVVEGTKSTEEHGLPAPVTNGASEAEVETSALPAASRAAVLPPADALPLPPMTSQTDRAGSQGPGTGSQDETQWIHIRAVISSAEAATCIGKGGENVTQIRKLSGAKCTVSDYSRGAVERILTVSGAQDAVAKAFGLIIRTLNNEPLEAPSTAQSKTYPLRLLIPHILIGSIIGKSGVRIREIQEASGARLNASDSCLPLSTERSLVVLGVADAVHIATYYVAVTLVEQLTERFGGPAASAYATRSGGPAGVVPGGMQVVPYVPQPAGGQFGHPDMYKRHNTQPPQRMPPQSYGAPQMHAPPQQPYPQHGTPYAATPRTPSYGGMPQQPGPYGQMPPQPGPHGQPAQPAHAIPGQPITQQIFIPNDMVGAIIGKGGAKINEIRHLSGSVIKINEPQDNSNERLVTITGTQECNQMALYMLYSRLESEKHRI